MPPKNLWKSPFLYPLKTKIFERYRKRGVYNISWGIAQEHETKIEPKFSSYRKTLWGSGNEFLWMKLLDDFPASIYLFKVNSRNTKKGCKICSKLIKTPERRHWRRSHVFIVNFEHISHLFLLTLDK